MTNEGEAMDNVISLDEFRKRKEQEKREVVAISQQRTVSTGAAKEARTTRINEAMAKWGHMNGSETQKNAKSRWKKETC